MTKPHDVSPERFAEIGHVLRRDVDILTDRWIERVSEGAEGQSPAHRDQLRDHLPEFIQAIGSDLGDGDFDQDRKRDALANDHGRQRWEIGWRLQDVIDDYQALRYVMNLHLRDQIKDLTTDDIVVIGQEIDQAIKKAALSYVSFQERNVAELEMRSQGLFEGVAVGVAHLSLQGEWLRINDTFCSIVGRSRDELRNLSLADITHPRDAAQDEERFADIAAGRERTNVLKMRFITGGGEIVWTRMTVALQTDLDERPLYLIITVQDLSHRVQLEHRLQEVEQTASEANAVKNEFLANVSHELRTPLNSILGMTQLALTETIPDAVRDYLETSQESARILLQLVNQVLDFSKLDAGKFALSPEPFRLRETLDEALKSLCNQAFSKGLELACFVSHDVPDALVGDALRFRQILTNLVGNAIKFTTDGEILVQVTPVSTSGQNVRILLRVRDTGEGISPEQQARVFAPFTQGDASSTREHGGVGLGLAIVYHLVQRMGGTIRLESEPSIGTTFFVELPLVTDPAVTFPEKAGVDTGLRQLTTVLVVDDNSVSRLVLENELKALGRKTVSMESAAEAMVELRGRSTPFEFTLIDAVMPETDGFSLIEQIREEGLTATTGPILVMMSPTDQVAFRERLRASTAVAVVTEKPISRPSLEKSLTDAIGHGAPTARINGDRHSATQPLHILLAEDIPANRKLVMSVLKKEGHRIDAVMNGREAVERVRQTPYDLILMDVQMPTMDGIQATRVIREWEQATDRARRLPIIALTAHAMEGDRDACLEAGMNDYLAKPIDITHLVDAVNRVASGRTARPSPPPSEDASYLPLDSVLDTEDALRRMRGDHDILREMAAMFVEDHSALVQRVRDAVAKNDHKSCERAAHAVKGLAANISGYRTANIAERIENLAMNKDTSQAAPLLDELDAEIDRLTEELRAKGFIAEQ